MTTQAAQPRGLGSAHPGFVLGAAVLICLAIIGPAAYFRSGAAGLAAAGGAALACGAGAGVALFASLRLRGAPHLVTALAIGMFARMGIPLVAILAVQLLGGALAQVGFMYYVLMFYLVTLAVETALVLRRRDTP